MESQALRQINLWRCMDLEPELTNILN